MCYSACIMDTLFVVVAAAADATTTTVDDDADNEDDFLQVLFSTQTPSLGTESCEYKHNDSHLIYLIIFYIGSDSLSLYVFFFSLLLLLFHGRLDLWPLLLGNSAATNWHTIGEMCFFIFLVTILLRMPLKTNIIDAIKIYWMGWGFDFFFSSFLHRCWACALRMSRVNHSENSNLVLSWLRVSSLISIHLSFDSSIALRACVCVQAACEFHAYLCLQIVRFASLLTFY